MDRPTAIPLRIGAWCVNPTFGQISREGEIVRVEARTMRLLLYLAEHAGEVVSIDELLDQVWAGVIVTPDSVYQAVASLRRLLGDDPKEPAYIATVPRLGYRMVAAVSPWADQTIAPVAPPPVSAATLAAPIPDRPTSGLSRRSVVLAGAATLCLMVVAAFVFKGKIVNRQTTSLRSVAVLPFLDLTTQEMNEEYFADGMTEELIDKLSKVPGLKVPPPTSSFYFKGKQIKLTEIAKSLGVAYVLDGSVRKSDTTLRVAARLIRAEDGYVIWSETYDRPLANKLNVQDDIANEVTKALRATIN
jgi:transcriptional activator of cad operon